MCRLRRETEDYNATNRSKIPTSLGSDGFRFLDFEFSFSGEVYKIESPDDII